MTCRRTGRLLQLELSRSFLRRQRRRRTTNTTRMAMTAKTTPAAMAKYLPFLLSLLHVSTLFEGHNIDTYQVSFACGAACGVSIVGGVELSVAFTTVESVVVVIVGVNAASPVLVGSGV